MNNKSMWSWCFYDFANSAFITSVATFIYPIYFKTVLVPEKGIELMGLSIEGKTLFPLLIAISLSFVFILSPWLGAKADLSSNRKSYLSFFCLLGGISTMSLVLTTKGDLLFGSLLFMGGMIGFSFGNVFYNSLIKEVASNEDIAKVSGRGWAVGYAGGFLALVIHMVIIQMHDKFGIDKEVATRIAMASTGLWWILFAIPLMLNVKEKSSKIQMNTDVEHQVKSPIKGMIHAFVTIRSVPYLGVFLMAFFMYNDAVQTTISQATNLANELLGMGMTEVLTAGMMIQFVAIFGSLLFLFLEKKIGTKKAVFIALINWCFILVWASIMQNKTEFYILCAWVGLVLGVTQSGSRTLFAQQIPQEHSAQLFSFYTVADRASAVVGPVLFAIGTMILPIRYSILPMLIMLIIGTIWLKKIPMKTEIN